MIRVGYIRLEIEANNQNVPGDLWSGQVIFRARPSYRKARIKYNASSEAQERFLRGTGTYEDVIRNASPEPKYRTIELNNMGPHIWKYSKSDIKLHKYFMSKIQREANSFATQIVRYCTSFKELAIDNVAARLGYIRLVESEIMRVINGVSHPQPTNEIESFEIDATLNNGRVPELVAAELVRDVFSAEHFEEFCKNNYVTITNGEYLYRIHRKTHAMIEVSNVVTNRKCRLCVVFQDPGMPPSDEVVMKYLLAKHDPDTLWKVGNKFG